MNPPTLRFADDLTRAARPDRDGVLRVPADALARARGQLAGLSELDSDAMSRGVAVLVSLAWLLLKDGVREDAAEVFRIAEAAAKLGNAELALERAHRFAPRQLRRSSGLALPGPDPTLSRELAISRLRTRRIGSR